MLKVQLHRAWWMFVLVVGATVVYLFSWIMIVHPDFETVKVAISIAVMDLGALGLLTTRIANQTEARKA